MERRILINYGERVEITPENLKFLPDSERAVAKYYLDRDYIVIHNIPVNGSVIDFEIKPKIAEKLEGSKDGVRLIEVTESPRRKLRGRSQKRRQKRDMRESGKTFFVFCKKELRRIKNKLDFGE